MDQQATPPDPGDELPRFVFDNLIIDGLARCRAIHEKSAALSHLEYASDNPGHYTKLVGRMATALAEELKRLSVRYDADRPNVLKQVQFVDDSLQDLGASLRYIEGSVTAKLPWSLSRPLQSLVDKYVRGKTLLLRPQWKHNYSIHLTDFRELYLDELRHLLGEATAIQVLDDFPSGFHIISFPGIERKNALFHCDLAHEIGHLVADDYLANESTGYLIEFRDAIVQQVEADRMIEPLWRPTQISRRLEKVTRIRTRALEELISDLFAANALGPASLFALLAVASTQDLDLAPEEDSGNYPPWRLRLRSVLGELDTAGFFPLPSTGSGDTKRIAADLSAFVDDIRSMVEPPKEQPALDENYLVSIAYRSVSTALTEVRQYLSSRFAATFSKPTDLYPVVYHLAERLRDGLPPNEHGSFPHSSPASLEAILNAGWFYRLSYLKGPFGIPEDQAHPDLRVLNRLTLKATELAHLHRDYQARRGSAR